ERSGGVDQQPLVLFRREGDHALESIPTPDARVLSGHATALPISRRELEPAVGAARRDPSSGGEAVADLRRAARCLAGAGGPRLVASARAGGGRADRQRLDDGQLPPRLRPAPLPPPPHVRPRPPAGHAPA